MIKNRKFKMFILSWLFVLSGCTIIQDEVQIKGETQVQVGETITLVASNNKKYEWESSNEDIASVDDGVITGIKVGEVQISILDENKIVATKVIRVIEARTLRIEGAPFVLIGEETQLEIQSNYPTSGGIWTSDDATIATVEEGLIRGIGQGKTNINFKINNKVVTFLVAVNLDYSPERLEIGTVEQSYIIGQGPYQLTATAYPEYLPQDFVWEVAGDKATIDATKGQITFLEEGDVYVICRSKYNNYVLKSVKLTSKYDESIDIKTVMFVGNSLTYVNDIPNTVKKMAKENGRVMRVTSVTVGGNSLTQILASRQLEITKALSTQPYDYLIIQEASADNFLKLQGFVNSGKEFDQIAKTYDVQLRLYETWCYSTTSEWLSQAKMSREEMQEKILNAYQTVSDEVGAEIHPVGRIFYQFSLDYPEINLYMDQNHASPIGSYLSSCVHYISIYQESVVGNTYDAQIGADIQLLIQEYVSEWMLQTN